MAELKFETLRLLYKESIDQPVELKQQFKENFAIADKDKDGLLDLNEFIVFHKM